ncbi:hypothetical protein MA16_Dca022249 [Dendrobium catenatum]|uniref:DUF4219 domain-containing protein n=1 Tax=Dendrobium catenatum TaxID=906689 RepID=A0A2I0WH58_9ASPA|nr:hypothetical protein MA16_Dca022249 [Dendrobium catenatum]
MTGSISSPSYPIFTGENYDYWSVKMITLFRSLDLWQIRVDKKKDAKALFILQLAVSDTIFPRIMRAFSSKQAWEILQEEFKGNSKIRIIKLQALRRELENLKMKETENTKEHYSKIITVVNQMRVYDKDISEEKVVHKILISLTASYDYVVAAIEESKDLCSLSVTELMSSLYAHELRLERRKDTTLETAFQSKVNLKNQKIKDSKKKSKEITKSGDNPQKKEFPSCKICKKTNHLEKDHFHKGKPLCFFCKKHGHEEKD